MVLCPVCGDGNSLVTGVNSKKKSSLDGLQTFFIKPLTLKVGWFSVSRGTSLRLEKALSVESARPV